MTNLELINDILLLIGVLGEGITASPEQGALALRQANELADSWAEDEVLINWSSNSDVTEDCPLIGMELAAFKPHLAIRLCPYFGRDPSPMLLAMANGAYEKLVHAQLVRSIQPVELQLPLAEGGLPFVDITDPSFR